MAITTRITCKAPWQRWSASDNCDMSQLQPDRSELRVNKGGLNVLPQREQMGLTNPPKAEVTGSNPVGCATPSAAILRCRLRRMMARCGHSTASDPWGPCGVSAGSGEVAKGGVKRQHRCA